MGKKKYTYTDLLEEAMYGNSKLDTATGNQTDTLLDPLDEAMEIGYLSTKQAPLELGHLGVGESKYDEGILPSQVSQLGRIRAEKQPGILQAGAAIGRAVAGIPLGVAENVGYVLDFKSHWDTMTGEGGDYSNFLTDLAQKGREKLGEVMPIYREDPSKVFDLGDPAWWFENGSGLVESIGGFVITGMGVGSVLGRGTKGLAKLIKAGAKGEQIAAGAATAMTSGELAYIEGAMGGQEVYKQTYQEILNKNLDLFIPEEEAKQLAKEGAGKAAALTVRMNTMINTGLNFTAAAGLMRSMKNARKLNSTLGKKAGESNSQWMGRLKDNPEFQSLNNNFFVTTGLEMGQEILEEVVNEIAQAEGLFKGKQLAGTLKEWENKPFNERLVDILQKDETALAALLGAVGGAGQHAITFNLPNAAEDREAQKDVFYRQADYLAERIGRFQKNQEDIREASEGNDINAYYSAVDKTFTDNLFDVYVNGAQEQLSTLYSELSSLELDEAKDRGYDVNPKSTRYYKKLAEDKVQQIDKLSRNFADIMSNYTADDTDAIRYGYGEAIFRTYLERTSVENDLSRNKQELEVALEEHRKAVELRGTEAGITEIVAIKDNISAIEQAIDDLPQKRKEIEKLSQNKTGNRILKAMYGLNDKKSIKANALDKVDQIGKDLEAKRVKNNKEFTKIVNDFNEAGGDNKDLNEQLNLTTQERFDIIFKQASITGGEATLKDLDKTYKYLTSKEGKNLYLDEQRALSKKRSADQAKEKKKTEDSVAVSEEKIKREDIVNKKKESDIVKEIAPEAVQEIVEPELELTESEEGIVDKEESQVTKELEDGDVVNISETKEQDAQQQESPLTIDKVIEAGTSFAYLSKEYTTIEGAKATLENTKSENLHKELESRFEFQVGDEVTLDVDKTATWEDPISGETKSYNDFISPDGTIDIDEVPIGIYKEGKVVAYVRTQSWINRLDTNGNFLNVADSDESTDPLYQNARKQLNINKAIREHIVQQGSTVVTINNKSTGHLSKNVSGKQLMSQTLPKLGTFTIVKDGEFYINKDDIYAENKVINSEDFINNLHMYNGIVFAALPTPAKDKALMVPVSVPNLNQAQVDSVYNAFRFSFAENKEVSSKVFEKTGITMTSKAGLLALLKKFTHVLDEGDAEFQERVDKEGSLNTRHLNYSTVSGIISYAKHNKGIRRINSLEELESQKEVFKDFLAEKLYSVQLSLLNSDEEASSLNIEDNGEVSSEIYPSYNELIKTKLSSNVIASEISEVEETYFDQPVIQFGTAFLEPGIDAVGTKLDPNEDGSPTEDDIDKLFDYSLDSNRFSERDDSVNDYLLSSDKKALLKDFIEKFIVVDSKTGTPYNSYKQTQVVDSIVDLLAKGLKKEFTLGTAVELVRELFQKRKDALQKIEDNFDDTSAGVKAKLNLETIDDVAELIENFDGVLRNWESFLEHSSAKLASIFGIKKTITDVKEAKEIDEILSAYDNLESELEKVSFDDGATFQTNHKDTASARLKLFLALQEKETRNFLNLKSFIPFDTVFDDLQMLLAGSKPGYASMIDNLRLVSGSREYINSFINRLENESQQLKNEFVVAFSKQYTPFITVLWSKKRGATDTYQLQAIETNRNSVTKRIEASWIESQKTSPIVKYVGGELVIDKEVAKQFEDHVKRVAANPTVDDANELLKTIGIDMPRKSLEFLYNNSKQLTGMPFKQHFTSGIFSRISKVLNVKGSETADIKLDINNPLTGINSEGSSIKTLALLTAQFSPSIYSNSHKDSERKTIHSYSLNTHLSHTVRTLLENEGNNKLTNGLKEISFSKGSYWLKQLTKDSKFRNVFSVSYLDGLRKRSSNQEGVKRKGQSDREMEIQAIGLFQNQNQGEAGGRKISHFIYPTISDKTTTPIITAIKHKIEVEINDDLSYTLGPGTREVILNIVRAEMNRIENYKPSKTNPIKGYDTGGATKFFTFPNLNGIAIFAEKEDGSRYVTNRSEIEQSVMQYVKDLVQNTTESWTKSGITTSKAVIMDSSYVNQVKRELTNPTNTKVALYSALDMEINYIIANANILQLIAGDPALHYKKSVENTLVEVQKRLAKDIAPGLDGNFAIPKYKTVFLEDKDTNSQHLSEYKNILKDKSSAYTGMEGTDAQELTTVKEHLDVMFAYGKLDDEVYKSLLSKIESNTDFNATDLELILQPMKPVYVGNEIIPSRDVNKITYIKSSSFPLVPQLTKGLDIDILRKEMEANDIARAAYVSAAKLGATKITKLWDGDNIIKDVSLANKGITLDRSGFRIQQEVPYKESKTKILTVSQMNKLLFEGILGIEGMPELKNRKEEIRKELFNNGKKKLFKDIGVSIKGNNFIFEDLTKIKKVLEKEAVDRGYPINDIQSLELTEDKKSFRIPLAFNASAKKFESLLLSIVTNTILKQKIAGKSYVQGSSAGFLTAAKPFSELTSSEEGSIVWSDKADLDSGLKFLRKENGEVQGAQMLVPFYFRDSEGKILDIKNYLKVVDGKQTIDSTKIDPSLMRLIGARIPNQGHSSMLPIEIVGFLPESMGDLVIVPDEITKQMGSDFDVDKLYTYQYEYNIMEDGLKKAEGIKNEYVDIHWTVLTHPEVMKRVLAPLDQTGDHSIAGEADLIHGIRSKNAIPQSFLYRREQQKGFIQNRSGKSGVAIFSLASTFNATIQDKTLIIDPKEAIRFKGITLEILSGKGTNSIADKATVISDMQSAAVDNAKEQRLDKLNLNDFTFPAANALAQLQDKNGKNVDIQYISRLLSQKIVKDYVTELEALSDSTIEEFVQDRKAEAFTRAKKKYENIIGESQDAKDKYLDDVVLSPDLMLDMIKKEEGETPRWAGQQLKALEIFEKLDTIGTELSAIQSALNADSQGAGKDLLNVSEKVNKIDSLANLTVVRGASQLTDPSTELGTAVQLGPVLANKLYTSLFPYNSEALKAINTDLLNTSGKLKLSILEQQRIFNDLKGYLFTQQDLFGDDNIDATRARLLIDSKDNDSLATRVKEAQDTWGRDNFFLKRLLAKLPTTKGDISTVTYVASAGERLDEQDSIKAFIDLFISENEQANQLADDLVTYSYVTASIQGATNFMKFIPTSYLKIQGVGEKLSDIDWTDNMNTSGFVRQYIQHHPELVPQVPEGVSETGGFSLPKINENLKSQFAALLIPVVDDTGNTKISYPKYLQQRDTKANRYLLYESDGDRKYIRINTLGGERGLLEYNAQDSLAKSLVKENQVKGQSSNYTNKLTPTLSPVVANPEANNNILKIYQLSEGDNKFRIFNTLRKISLDSDNSSHRTVANLLVENSEDLPDLTFSTKSRVGKGFFKQDTRVLNVNPASITSANDFEKTLLHEILHAYTSHLVKAKQSGMSVTSPQARAINSIEALQKKVIGSLNENDTIAFNSFKAKFSKEGPKGSYTQEEINKFYGLVKTEEFITMVMTHEPFQKFLNTKDFDGKTSLFERFLDIISKLLEDISTSLGIEVSERSALKSAITDIVDLISHTGDINTGEDLDYNLSAGSTEYSNNRPVNTTNAIRKEFGLINNSGLPKKLEYEIAFKKSKLLNTTNKRFQKLYGTTYKATPTKIPGEPGDSKTYWNVEFEIRPRIDFSLDALEDEVLSAPTIDPTINEMIDRIDSRIFSYKRTMSESKTDKAVFKDKIDKLETQKEQIKAGNNLKSLQAISKDHLDWVDQTLDKKIISPADLREIDTALSVWKDLKRVFEKDYGEGGKFREAIASISHRAEDLNNRAQRITKTVAMMEANKSSKRKVNLGDLEFMEDVKIAPGMFLDLAAHNNKFTQSISKKLKRSGRNADIKFNEWSNKINDELEIFKKSEEFKKSGFTKFLQLDSEGNWTGNLTIRYSQDLFDERAKQWRKVEKSNRNKKAFRNYYRWKRINYTVVDSRILFNEDGSKTRSKEAVKHVKELINEFGENRATELLKRAEEHYKRYLENKASIIIEYESRFEINPDYTQDNYDNDLRSWVIRNSPKSYLSSYDGTFINKEAQGEEYIVSVPKKIYDSKNEPGWRKTKWYDDRYEDIENDPASKRFYDFFRDTLDKMVKELPDYETHKLQSNFLPSIRRELIESFKGDGLKGAMKNYISGQVNQLTSVERRISSDRDIHTGKVHRKIPVRFLEPLAESTEQSKDLGKMLLAFTMMAQDYKQNAKIEDTVLLMQRVVNEAIEQKVNSNKGAQMDEKGKLYQIKDGLPNIKLAVEHAINSQLYGDRRVEGDATGLMLTPGLKGSGEATGIKKKIIAYNKQAKKGEITSEELLEFTEPLNERLVALKAKDVTDVDVADKFLKITQLKGMAYNVFGATNNITYGIVSNIIQAAGGEDFSMKEIYKAYTIMLSATGKALGYDNDTAKKVKALMQKVNMLGDVNEAAYNGTDIRKNTGLNRFTPYGLHSSGEYFVQGMVLVGRALNKKVKTLEGKTTSLFEAFDTDGNWRVDEYGENKGWDGDVDIEGEMKDFIEFQDHSLRLGVILHGNYDIKSFPPAKRHIFLRAALQFRSWLAESVKRRFGGETYDSELERDTKGFYLSVASNPKAFFSQALMSKEGLANLSPVDKANLKKGFVEMLFMLGIMGSALVVKMLGDGDDDDDKATTNVLLNQIYRLESDMTFYLSPSSFNRILSSPIPAIRTYLDAEKALSSTVKFLLQPSSLDSRRTVYAEDLARKWAKVFPFLNQGVKFENQTTKVFK